MSLLKDILEQLARGEITLEEAEKSMKVLAIEEVGELARFDIGREIRHGVPEVVIAEGKTAEALREIVEKVVTSNGRIIISRLNPTHVEVLKQVTVKHKWRLDMTGQCTLTIKSASASVVSTGGRVGIIAAGTSDIPVAEEAKLMAQEMGCDVSTAYDVGVAGIHRLIPPLKEMIEKDVDVIVVVAGREGALPTLMAGMVDIPLIAVPTSYGYGLGGKGIAALMAMLQSCALGMAVVNIDGGIPAGAVAALMANRAARFRPKPRGKLRRQPASRA
jgi:NCAIR mutase (PurE)-related protein